VSEGGSKWELERAAQRLADATGNPDAASAALDLAAALNNGMSTTLIPTLQQVLGSVVKREIGDLAVRLDRSDRVALDWRTEFRVHLDSRLDNYGAELDDVVEKIGGLGAGQLRLQAGFQDVRAGLSSIAETVDGLRTSLAETDQRVRRVEDGAMQRFGLLDQLNAQIVFLTNEIARVRDQTIADELSIDERRALTEEIRWIRDNRDRIVLRDGDDGPS